MNIILDVEIEEERWQFVLPNVLVVVEEVKDAVFSYVLQHESLALLKTDSDVTVNLCLSNDEQVHRLNRDFRHVDKPTNVLSFANLDSEDFATSNDLFGEIELGDIIIALETMQKEAEIENITFHDHFCHLLTHGLLHLLGYDHIKEQEAAYMENMEKNILRELHIANPYENED